MFIYVMLDLKYLFVISVLVCKVKYLVKVWLLVNVVVLCRIFVVFESDCL